MCKAIKEMLRDSRQEGRKEGRLKRDSRQEGRKRTGEDKRKKVRMKWQS